MEYFCSSILYNSDRCKNKVEYMGQFCELHSPKVEKKDMCNCELKNGRDCPYEAITNGLCEFHQEIVYCEGKTLLGGICLRIISSGKYCINCKSQEGIIFDNIKTAADEYRGYLSSKGNPVITKKEPITVDFGFDINMVKIPENLQKVHLLKPPQCCICLDELEDKYRSLNCGHYFHDDCLSGLFVFSCPVCRREIRKGEIPNWLYLRICSNVEKDKENQEIERRRATMEMALSIFQGDINELQLDQEDFNSNEILQLQFTPNIDGNRFTAVLFTRIDQE